MGNTSACRGHAGLKAHVRECGVGGRVRVIDVCAGVHMDDLPHRTNRTRRVLPEPRPPRVVAVATPCGADAPGVADDAAGEGKRATVGESLRNFEKGG